jgi:ABC-type transport system involved in multi-copper enzyme maturation permease subunit
MTASILTRASVPPATGRFTGLSALLRKDATEWLRGRRAWVVAAAVTAFMVLTAANGWINATIAAQLPDGAEVAEFSLVAADNLMMAVGAQVFVLAAILAVGSLIAGERQAGTLAWVASKPVSREAIWLSKWISASVILGVTAAAIPMAVATGLAVVLYGAPPVGLVLGLVAGMVAVVAFFAAVGLAAGTVMPGQAAITATGIGVFALVPLFASVLPFDVSPFLPTSMLTWFAGIATGMPVSWVTPLAWLAVTGALAAASLRRMSRMEL